MPSLLHRVLRRACRCFYHRSVDCIYCVDLTRNPPEDEPPRPDRPKPLSRRRRSALERRYGLRFKKAESGEVAAIARDARDLDREEVAKRLEECEGFLFYENDRLGGWFWVTDRPRPCEGARPFKYPVDPPPGCFYAFDGFVLPHARGHGGLHLLYMHVIDQLRERGARALFFTCWQTNRNMRRMAERVGFEHVGTLTYERVLFWTRRDISDLSSLCEKVGTNRSRGPVG